MYTTGDKIVLEGVLYTVNRADKAWITRWQIRYGYTEEDATRKWFEHKKEMIRTGIKKTDIETVQEEMNQRALLVKKSRGKKGELKDAEREVK